MTGRVGPAADIELLVIEQCPHEQAALELFRRVLDDAGCADEIRIRVIQTDEEAARRGFPGSPTFLINGVDLFAEVGTPPGVACRVYPNRDGLHGLPSRNDLMGAVARLLPRHQS